MQGQDGQSLKSTIISILPALVSFVLRVVVLLQREPR